MVESTATKRGIEDTDDGYNAPPSPGGGLQPPTKRRRMERDDKQDTSRKPNHPCDSLGCLPKDILNMIMSHLDPLDLLRVSCLQTKFRHIVQEDPSLWDTARENFMAVNPSFETLLPTLPGLSEAAYINLLFGMQCSRCSATRKLDWRIRWGYHVLRCENCARMEHWADEIRALESTMGSDELESFQARELFVLAWAEQMAPTIEAERDARKRRFNLIIDKLCAAGWKKELVGSTKSKLRRLPIVRQSKILTEQAWNKIKLEVLAFMEGRRAKRIDVTTKRLKKFLELYKEATATLPASTPRLNAIDIASAWTFSGPIYETDIEKEVQWPCAEAFNKDVASANEAMLGMMQDRLLKLMDERGLSRDPMQTPEEQLVSVRFKCTSCSKGLVYPAVLTHSCGARRYQRARVVKGGEGGDDVIEYSLQRKCRWRGDDFVAVAPSPTRKLLARVEAAKKAMYICRTCHMDSRSDDPFWSEERLGVLNRQEAAVSSYLPP
ncbi:hypothetical protein CPB85DRAFT_795616 [Mucidula mucida]|nr:hypothetical protein CPB85DRAFT_795616 [Mucidula mucida]